MKKTVKSIVFASLVLLFSVSVVTSCTNSKAQVRGFESLSPANEEGFLQSKLPYAYDALEPYIDAQTMELHYSKHHAGYTKKFNKALVDANVESRDIKEIFAHIEDYPAAVRNNGGGYFNHALFWKILGPEGAEQPEGKLLSAIQENFGSFEAFKELFSKTAATQFGSGWAWLVLTDEGKLVVSASSNQDNPLMSDQEVKGTPILTIDVWEHAYYLNYQNLRTAYIENFWNVVNWEFVEELYAEAT